MPEWLKAFTDVFGSGHKDPANRPVSLRERLEEEKSRLKESEKTVGRGNGQHRLPGETDEEARRQDARALGTLLAWKLDVQTEGLDINPARVDGYWFGVERYLTHAANPTPENPYDVSWKLYFYRPCVHCRHLIHTLELGDYTEVTEAARRMTRGEETAIRKSTTALAQYLRQIEGDRPDPLLPRRCPKCRKMIKGMKDE